MAAATIRAYQDTGASGATNTKVDKGDSGTTPRMSVDDAVQGSLPIQIPTATGTNYSAFKMFYLRVTATGTTSVTNRKVSLASSITTGLKLWWLAASSYTQGSAPTAKGTNDANPGSYTEITTTPTTWDSASAATSSSGRNGKYLQVVLGVSNLFTGGGGVATLPDLSLSYDES